MNIKFSEEVLNKSISSINNELAWKKEDIFQAIDELSNNNIAILGGDVWCIDNEKYQLPIINPINKHEISFSTIKDK